MRIIGFWSTKLIVGNRATARDVLQKTSPAVVAEDDVELAVRTEAKHAAVVITTRRLTGILLQCVQLDQVAIKREYRTIPDVTIDSISQQRHLIGVCGVNAGTAFSPVEVDKTILREVRVQGDSQQAPFGGVVDCEIQWRGLQSAIDDPLYFAGRFFQHKEIVWSNERHTCR